jgi:hypothetical protein
MAATGVAMAAASLLAAPGDDDDLDETLAQHVRCWFAQFAQRPWWQTLSAPDLAGPLPGLAAEESARRGLTTSLPGAPAPTCPSDAAPEQPPTRARRAFEQRVEEQTREALALFV